MSIQVSNLIKSNSEGCREPLTSYYECAEKYNEDRDNLCPNCMSQYNAMVEKCKGDKDREQSITQNSLLTCYQVKDKYCTQLYTNDLSQFECNYCTGYNAALTINGRTIDDPKWPKGYRECADNYTTAFKNNKIEFKSNGIANATVSTTEGQTSSAASLSIINIVVVVLVLFLK